MSEELKAAQARIACLEGEIAKRDETIAQLEPQLHRAIQANYDLREELAACRIAVENCELFRARIAELEQDLAYFPSTVRSLAETVTEREAEINQLRAELSALKAQEPVAWAGVIEDCASLFVTEPQLWKAIPLYAAPVSEAKAHGNYAPASVVWIDAHHVIEGNNPSFIKDVALVSAERTSETQIPLVRLNAAPVHQVGVPDGLEVVGWYRMDDRKAITPYPSVCATWHKMGVKVGAAYSDSAHAIIDGLRGEVERLERAEKNDAIAYKAVLERQDELRAELAELAAIKAKSVMPDVNLAAKALCSRHAAICGVDEDDQWKEYGQDFIADAETVLANSRLCAATVLEVNAHCAVIPEPYGWVAAGSFYTDRESAICAAEKTPCIDVYSRPQMNALENRSLQRQELAEELARQLNASCAEIRNMRNLYAAPVSEAKAQGVVLTDEELCSIRNQVACNEVRRDDDSRTICVKHGRALEAAVLARITAAPAAPAADATVRQATDGGRNQSYEGLFDGETEEQRASRLAAHRSKGVV